MMKCHDIVVHQGMTKAAELHGAVKRGDLPAMRRLLESDPQLVNARSETSQRNKHGLTPLGRALGGVA
jgi:hypothetical protein